jgi:hypothetical protein
MTNAYEISVGITEGKRQVGRHKRRWKNNIETNLKEVGSEDVDWIHLAPEQVVVNMVMKFPVRK